MNAENFYELCRLIKVYEERLRSHDANGCGSGDRAIRNFQHKRDEMVLTIKFLTQLKESAL